MAGMRASERADPMALVKRYMDWTKDFIDGGALVYAYSSPVTEMKISARPMKTYAGVWTTMWTWFGSEDSPIMPAGHFPGEP